MAASSNGSLKLAVEIFLLIRYWICSFEYRKLPTIAVDTREQKNRLFNMHRTSTYHYVKVNNLEHSSL